MYTFIHTAPILKRIEVTVRRRRNNSGAVVVSGKVEYNGTLVFKNVYAENVQTPSHKIAFAYLSSLANSPHREDEVRYAATDGLLKLLIENRSKYSVEDYTRLKAYVLRLHAVHCARIQATAIAAAASAALAAAVAAAAALVVEPIALF